MTDRTDSIQVLTLADVLARLDTLSGLKPERRRDLKHAVSKIGAQLHPTRDLTLVPVRGRQIRNAIASISAAQLGCTKKTRDNLISLARVAIESCIAGQNNTTRGKLGRSGSPVAAVWMSVLKREKGERGPKVGAIPFAKWAEAAGFRPDELPEDSWDRFLVWQRETSWARDWEAAARTSVQAWNKLVASGAPGRAVRLPDRVLFMKPLSAYPLSFQADVQAYTDYCRNPAEWIAKRPACRRRDQPYSAATIQHHRNVIRWAAALLVSSGFPIEEIKEIGVLGAGENPARILETLERREIERFIRQREDGIRSERGEEKTSSQLTLAKTLRTIILNWKRPKLRPDGSNPIVDKFRALIKGAMETRITLENGTTLKFRIKPEIGLSTKNQRRIEAAMEPEAFKRLWTMPERVMRRIDKQYRESGRSHPTVVEARKFEAALACAFQRTKPLRGQDLRHLRFGSYVSSAGENGHGRFEFVTSKNNRKITLVIKGEVFEMYERFLRVYRPVLLPPNGNDKTDAGFVFVGKTGGAISLQSLVKRMNKLVYAETGLVWNNHLWRHHCMVLLRDNGGTLEDGADLLGISVEVARRAYDKNRQAEAADLLEKAAIAKMQSCKTSLRDQQRPGDAR